MAADINTYKSDLVGDFERDSSVLQGIAVSGPLPDRPEYISSELKKYQEEVIQAIPTVRKGDPKSFLRIEAALQNANEMKAKINTKRLESFLGNRVKKTAIALSYYQRAAEDPNGLPAIIFTEITPK